MMGHGVSHHPLTSYPLSDRKRKRFLAFGDRYNSGARVFSYIACLRRIFHLFQLSFIPLEPYPARYARHLPHAGKALFVVILFPHMRVFALTLWGKRYSRIVVFPIGEGGPRQRWIGYSR